MLFEIKKEMDEIEEAIDRIPSIYLTAQTAEVLESAGQHMGDLAEVACRRLVEAGYLKTYDVWVKDSKYGVTDPPFEAYATSMQDMLLRLTSCESCLEEEDYEQFGRTPDQKMVLVHHESGLTWEVRAEEDGCSSTT